MATAIEIEGLGKQYVLGTDPSGYDTLRDAVRRRFDRSGPASQSVWALNELDLEVPAGEILGVLGANGAGKSTLLKVLAGITYPTRGVVRTRGRVGTLLEVGTGFHPELTGRENVYLSGSILGMPKSEIGRRFDEIVEFAGVNSFLDTPVKRYSAGMRLRLAFGIAAHIEPPIIAVDEVLAVGDAAFREKCLGKMRDIGSHGRTVVFVSHDLGAITRLCSRAAWLADGRLASIGSPSDIVSRYLEAGESAALETDLDDLEVGAMRFHRAWIEDLAGNTLTGLTRGDALTVAIRLSVLEAHPSLDCAFWIENRDGTRVLDDALSDYGPNGFAVGTPGTYELRATIPGVLPTGRYSLGAWIGSEYEELLDRTLLVIKVAPRPEDQRYSIERRRTAQPDVSWNVQIDG